MVYRILGIGELLWDMLPAGPQLGGAPANYGVMSGRLGDYATILSRIGRDELGEKALEVLKPFPVDCTQVQMDSIEPTGRVTVAFEDGQPSYIIHQPVAWDNFELSENWLEQAAIADAICFGSLAQRSDASRRTIHAIVRATLPACQRIFDVNLRAPFYTAGIVRESLELASVMKMNDVELPLVLSLLGLPETSTLRDGAERMLAEFSGLKLVAVTCGGSGSLLVSPDGWHKHPGIPTRIADTIGAGDAFTAAMTHYLLRKAPLETLNEAGNRWGSFVASQSGAMPAMNHQVLENIRRGIEG